MTVPYAVLDGTTEGSQPVLDSPIYRITDEAEIRDLVRENGWAVLVSHTSRGLVATHMPVMLEEGDEFVVLGHFGRPDDEAHEIGENESMLIVSGTHGYVSAGWYGTGPTASTWDFVVAHLYGVPEPIGDPEENLRALAALQAKYESALPEPVLLEETPELALALSRGARGFRLRVTRWQGRNKMSQNRSADVVERIVDQLEADPANQPYANPALAAAVRAANPAAP